MLFRSRVEQLKTLWTEGLSASQIARALGGVTRNAVIGKVHRLGLAGRASPSRSERPRLPMAPKVPSVRTHVPAAPVVEPASVLTTPFGVIFRTVLPAPSAM